MGKSHRKSLIKEVIERLDSLMAIGESRGQAKEIARAAGESTWAFSTSRIHSYKTREVYQEQSMLFVKWVRETYGVKQFADLETRADELASVYLRTLMEEHKSAWTLLTARSALRVLFQNRRLADTVALPKRRRQDIIRSRIPRKSDRCVQPANWPDLVRFLEATGLRRDEVKMLKVGDIVESDPDYEGAMTVNVRNGKGGKQRTVPLDPEDESEHVLQLLKGRSPDERVFPRIPNRLDVHAYRRRFAQRRYLRYAPGRDLPPADKVRLSRNDYDRVAALKVTKLLGHNRIGIVLTNYIR